MRYVCCAVGAVLLLTAMAVAQASRAPGRPAASQEKKAQKIAEWLGRAEAALGAGDASATLEAAGDVIEADPKNPRAFHLQALGYVAAGDMPKAEKSIEEAMKLAEAPPSRGSDRALLLNFSMILINRGKSIRAAKYLADYLDEHKAGTDEAIINALAVALSTSDASARSGQVFPRAEKVYHDANARLEKSRPGYRRWGIKWMKESEFTPLWERWQRDEKALDAIGQNWDKAAAEYRAARAEIARLRRNAMISAVPSTQIQTMESRARAAYDRAQRYADQYRRREATVKRPTFPEVLAMAPVNQTTPTAATDATAAGEAVAGIKPVRLGGNIRPAPAPPPAARRGGDAEIESPGPTAAVPPSLVVRKGEGKRTVTRTAAGFPVAPGLIVTTASAVKGARQITLTDTTGGTCGAKLERLDEKTGLAMLRMNDPRLPVRHVKLADQFRAGAVSCVSLASGIFEVRSESISGFIKPGGENGAGMLSVQREPRRAGSPLVAGREVVGVALVQRGGDINDIPMASLAELRAFCGADLAAEGPFGEIAQVVIEVLAIADE